MGEYGSGVSLTQSFNYDKERLLKALDGQLVCGESEYGFMYGDASPEDCREFIISVFDNAVFHALQGYGSGRALEKAAEANGIDIKSGQFFKDYMHFRVTDPIKGKEEEEYRYGDPEQPEEE